MKDLLKFYLGISSSILFVIFLYNLWNIWINFYRYYFLTAEDYLIINIHEINSCEYRENKDIKEINLCKEKIKKELLQRRTVDFKTKLINDIIYTIVFFIAFIFHYVSFRKNAT